MNVLQEYLHVGYGQVYIKGPDVDSVCYGNTISLTCSYPSIWDRVNGSSRWKYVPVSLRNLWTENGIRISRNGRYTSLRTVNRTASGLDVTLTREQFKHGTYYYSCYLLLYNRSRETSSDVEIDPPGERCTCVLLCAFAVTVIH